MPYPTGEHFSERWVVDPAEMYPLAIVTEGTGLAVLELGLRPSADGYVTLRRLAGYLVAAHNDELGDTAVSAADSVAAGFVGDHSSEPWNLASRDRFEDGRQVMTSVIYAGRHVEHVAAVLGEDMPSEGGAIQAAHRLVAFHNALLDAGAGEGR